MCLFVSCGYENQPVGDIVSSRRFSYCFEVVERLDMRVGPRYNPLRNDSHYSYYNRKGEYQSLGYLELTVSKMENQEKAVLSG
jgi:hypothetical protein